MFSLYFLFLISQLAYFPDFGGYYIDIKWALTFLFVIISFRKLKIPKIILPKYKILFLIFIFSPLITNYFNNIPFLETYFVKRIVFLALLLLLIQKIKEENFFKNFFLINIVAIFTTSLLFLLFFANQVFSIDIPPNFPFGNSNLAAQFIATALIICFYGIYLNYYTILTYVAIFFGSSCLFIIKSRSSFLSLIILIIALVSFRKHLRIPRLKSNKFLLLLGILILSFGFSKINLKNYNLANSEDYTVPVDKRLLYYKDKSSQRRLSFWRHAFLISLRNPLGVGENNFGFKYNQSKINHQEYFEERKIPPNPHNEFFRILVENGWLYLICSLIIFFYFFRYIFTIFYKNKKRHKYFLLGSMIIFYHLIEAMFQFPFLNPNSFIFLAFASALIFSNKKKIKYVNLYLRSKFIFFTLFILTSGYFSYLLLNGLSYKFSNTRLSTISCKIAPSNWNLCIIAIDYYKSNGDYDEGLKITNQLLKLNPNNHPIIREEALLYLKMDNMEKACESFNRYNYYFKGLNYISEDYDYFCFEANLEPMKSEDNFNTDTNSI